MHPDWLVLICVGKNAEQVHSPPYTAVCLPYSPALSPELAAHQREGTLQILPLLPGPESQERQLSLQRQGKGRKKQVLLAEDHVQGAQEELQPMLEHSYAIYYSQPCKDWVETPERRGETT